jgi:hypothetical protein
MTAKLSRSFFFGLATAAVAAAFSGSALAQDGDYTAPPAVPTQEEIQRQKDEEARLLAESPSYVPLDVDFRIGVVGDFEQRIELETGVQTQIKSPLILIDPRTGSTGVYAKNFPARIVANSPNGNWVIGISASAAVEGSSGSRMKECAVSLNLTDDSSDAIKMIAEFPLHSSFQALFPHNDNDVIYYCVNEPGAENTITRFNLDTREAKPVPADGNRFNLYGLTRRDPLGMWISDAMSEPALQIADLIDIQSGGMLRSVSFPGVQQVLAKPDGTALLGVVSNRAESSLGYYTLADGHFNQVPKLVLTRPTFKWTHNNLAIVAKESTTTRDRFLWIDVATGEAREVFSGYFKTSYWDISPNDDCLVFITDNSETPLVFVVPLDSRQTTVNRIRLTDVTNVSWIGCLNTPSGGGSWWERLLPF